jgi:type IV pilus assembly protein PilV
MLIAIKVSMMDCSDKKSAKTGQYKLQSENGVSLIEVLVSIVILSIGLLGIAGLQASVTKYKINTWSRAASAVLYSDLTDRVRTNSDVAGANFITGVTEDSLYALSATWAAQKSAILATPSPNCETATCTTTQRAAYDMGVWRQRVRAALPQGAALVTGDRRDGINVTLMWFDKELTDKGSATDSVLVSSAVCTGTEAGLAQQSCCPTVAAAPAGVRCTRFVFIP